MSASILFTTVCRPFDLALNEFEATDQMAFRLTRDQGLFVMYEHTHVSALHLIAQNLSLPSIVLEYPTFDQLEVELKKQYDYVAISFKICNIDKLAEMCDVIRKVSPHTKIVIGGYGTICTPLLLEEECWRNRVDAICQLEGISFMKDLLKEPKNKTIHCQLPKIGSTLPWLNPRPIGTIGIILSGLGCVYQCPFCTTSAYTKGKYEEVMTAEQIYQAMRGYWSNTPFTNSATLYDENFLDHKQKTTELGQLLNRDTEFGLKKFNYFAFGSLSAISKFEPEELLLYGLDTLWVGVESKKSPLTKTKGLLPEDAFPQLHSMGIKTVGSWIIGEDFQTPENIEEDGEFFISLDATFQQLSILTVAPPLKLWKDMKSQGRIPDNVSWKDYHLYGNTFVPKYLTFDQMTTHLDKMYKKIYEENGPAMLKVLEVNLNGYEYCVTSKNKLLKEEKSQFFKNRCDSYFPLLKAGIAHAPTEKVKRRLEDLDKRYQECFGQRSKTQMIIEDQILKKADEAIKSGLDRLKTYRKEPFRRYIYPEMKKRTGRKPYIVEYPEFAKAYSPKSNK